MLVDFNGKTIEIKVDPKPNNCRECPFLRYHADEEYGGFDTEYCMFGNNEIFGRYVDRPTDCPLDLVEVATVIDIDKRI